DYYCCSYTSGSSWVF
nr:immunoglobulin light chain junction region [Macaca mulatta]MOX37032.1 immunoglobulin light chain junction region [Macaca mulatta]